MCRAGVESAPRSPGTKKNRKDGGKNRGHHAGNMTENGARTRRNALGFCSQIWPLVLAEEAGTGTSRAVFCRKIMGGTYLSRGGRGSLLDQPASRICRRHVGRAHPMRRCQAKTKKKQKLLRTEYQTCRREQVSPKPPRPSSLSRTLEWSGVTGSRSLDGRAKVRFTSVSSTRPQVPDDI